MAAAGGVTTWPVTGSRGLVSVIGGGYFDPVWGGGGGSKFREDGGWAKSEEYCEGEPRGCKVRDLPFSKHVTCLPSILFGNRSIDPVLAGSSHGTVSTEHDPLLMEHRAYCTRYRISNRLY